MLECFFLNDIIVQTFVHLFILQFGDPKPAESDVFSKHNWEGLYDSDII